MTFISELKVSCIQCRPTLFNKITVIAKWWASHPRAELAHWASPSNVGLFSF